VERFVEHIRGEVGGKRIGKSHGSGQLSAEQAGPEDPDRHLAPGSRDRLDSLPWLDGFQVMDQLPPHGGEVVCGGGSAAQSSQRLLVSARCPPQTEINPPRIEGLQRTEFFRYHQRRMVGQHHAGRTHADAFSACGNEPQCHGRCRAGDAGHVVVFGHPEAPVAELFGMAGQIPCVQQGPRVVCCPG